MLFLISGNGKGAGKSRLASLLLSIHDDVVPWSLAFALRSELTDKYADKYPDVNWYDKSQTYKENTFVDGKSVREHLLELGQARRLEDPDYWCKRLQEEMEYARDASTYEFSGTIEDLRYVSELNFFKQRWPVCHLHVKSKDAIHEPEFDNDELERLADYVMERK